MEARHRTQRLEVEPWSQQDDGPLSEAALRTKLELRGYQVTKYVYPPRTRFEAHTHDIDKIDAVLSGQFRMTVEGCEAILGTGDCLAVARGVEHSAEVI